MLALAWSSDFSIGNIASVVVVLGVFAGSTALLLYGRRAIVTVTATLVEAADHSMILQVRPSLQAVGQFKIKVDQSDESYVAVIEVLRTDQHLVLGKTRKVGTLFGKGFAIPGETLNSTVLFDLGIPPKEVDGWLVVISVGAQRIGSRQDKSWDDRIYVPVPKGEPAKPGEKAFEKVLNVADLVEGEASPPTVPPSFYEKFIAP
jgi:hypothetical protein